MTKLSKINDQLMGLTLTELNQVLDMVYDVKTLKCKICFDSWCKCLCCSENKENAWCD